MDSPIEAFLERFRSFGAAPSAETYLPLFDPEATLYDSGMVEPIRVPEIPEHIETILRLVPDFQMVPERWRAHAGTLFVEARNSATLGRGPIEWPSVYCVDLRGAHVIRGRRYYDRRPLFARLASDLPDLPPGALGSREPAAVQRALGGLVVDAKRTVSCEAGDEELSFVEWSVTGSVGGAPLTVGGVDRFDPDGGKSYFDTLALAARLSEAAA